MTPASLAAPAPGAARPPSRPRRLEPLRAAPDPAGPDAVDAEEASASAAPAPALVFPTLVTDDGVTLPSPPSPPFTPSVDGWEARLPGRIGRKVTVAVSARGLTLGGTHVPWDDVVHTTVSLGTSNDQGVDVGYELGTRDGRTVKARTSTLSSGRGDHLFDVADHVWAVLRETVGPRLRAPIVAAVSLGRRVEVAGLLFDREGIAPRRRPDEVVSWKHIGDPVVAQRMVRFPAGVKTLQTPIASRDSLLLLDLLPQLRSLALRGQLR